MKHYIPMSEISSSDDEAAAFTGQDILYREKGVSALDVRRAADALLRRGQKPSIAAIREHLGGGSPNTLGPLLEKYWKGLGTRLPSGPDSLDRVPESLARMTEALWLRSLDEARERTKAGASPSQKAAAALERKVTELTAALAEARAGRSELDAQLLASLRDRLELREQVQQLTALLKAEQGLRAQDQRSAAVRSQELQTSRSEIVALARRRLASGISRKFVAKPAKPVAKSGAARSKSNLPAVSTGKRQQSGRTRLARQGRR